MQATGTLQETRLSRGFIAVVLAVLCALVLGAAGGYLARPAATAGGGAVQRLSVAAGQGSSQSDLTRALPVAGAKATPGSAAPDHGFIP